MLGRQDPQLVVILDRQTGAVSADVEPVEFRDQFGHLALAQVETLEQRPLGVVLGVRGALAEDSGHGLA